MGPSVQLLTSMRATVEVPLSEIHADRERWDDHRARSGRPDCPGERASTASAIDLSLLALVPFVGALRNVSDGARTFMCDDAVHSGKQFESEWSLESFYEGRLAGVQVLRLNNVVAYGVAHQLRH